MKLLTHLLLATVLLSARAQSPKNEAPKPYLVPETYEVYAAVVPDEWNATQSKKIIIAGETVSSDMCLTPGRHWRNAMAPAMADFVKVNRRQYLIQGTLQISRPYELVSREKILAFFRVSGPEDGWKHFHESYPESSGWMELSGVGFNNDKTIAIVYVGHHCGPLCGGGGFKVLQKKNGKWQPMGWQGTGCAWAS